jgi:hypothetical protein
VCTYTYISISICICIEFSTAHKQVIPSRYENTYIYYAYYIHMFTIHNMYVYIYIYQARPSAQHKDKCLPPVTYTYIYELYNHKHTHTHNYDIYLKTHSSNLQSTHIIYTHIYIPYIIHKHAHTHLHERDEGGYGPSSGNGLLRKILTSQCPSIISYVKQLYRVLFVFQKSCLCLFVVNG